MTKISSALIFMVTWVCLHIVLINGQAGTIGFYLNGVHYPNGSTVLRTDIGEDDAALQCTTNNTACCSDTEMRGGEFYFPDEGGVVPIRIASYSLGYYRNRGTHLIRLNRRSNGTTTGQFHCEIPDASGTNLSLFINIVDITVSITPHGNNTAGESYTLQCSAAVNGSTDQVNITWLGLGDSELPLEMVNTTDSTSTLTFSLLFTYHAGNYTCRVILMGAGVETRVFFSLAVEAGISLSLRGTPLPNNSYVDVGTIGAGGPDGRNDAEGLLCLTNKEDCCALAQVGEGTLGQWFFPNGSTVESKSSNNEFGRTDYFFRNRFSSVVRLLRVGQPTERGLFRCEVPNANNVNHTLYVNIVNISPTPTSATHLPTTTFGSMPSPTPSISITISITSSGGNNAGEVFVLSCFAVSIGSNDQPTITWLDNISQVVSTSGSGNRIAVSGTTMNPNSSYSNSLTFNPLVTSDAGLYMCKVMLGGVTKIKTTTISVNNSALQVNDGGQTPVTGQSYNLTCDIVGSISFEYTYRWKKNGAMLNETGQVLSFSQLRLSDAGQYTCEVVGTVTIISNALNVSLQVPTPEVVISDHSSIPYNGTVFNLTGAIQLDMSIINIGIRVTWEWTFGEMMLISQETRSPPHENVLTFEPLATDSTGEYMLRVTLAPLDNLTFIVENRVNSVYNLSVLPLPPRPPSISVISRHPLPDDFCGEIMTLSCTANPLEGLFTPPVISWIDPQGSEVPNGGNHNPKVENQSRHLVFNDVSANNRGLYECRAVINIPEALIANYFDESEITVDTLFPSQVKNLSCVPSLASNQLSFSWQQPTLQNGDKIDYRVVVKELKHRNGTKEVTELSIEDNTTTREVYNIIDGLDPEVPYSVTVMARNLGGCGEEQQIYCFTQEGEPPPPINVTVVRFNSTTIGVSWAMFTLVELKGLASYVITYDIIISSRKRALGGTISVPWTSNRIIISNLQPGAQYRIFVHTSTSAGMSDFAEPTEVLTDTEQGNPPTATVNNTTTSIIAIVSGVVAVIVVLAVAAIIIAALKFALKLHRRKSLDLQNRLFDSPSMTTNEFYESCGDRLIRIDTVDHNYATVDKYNASYVEPKAPQPYEEIQLKAAPHSLPQSQLHSSGSLSYAHCPLYASATSESDNKQTAETSFTQGIISSNNVGQVTDGEEARYVTNELQDNGTDPAYATVR